MSEELKTETAPRGMQVKTAVELVQACKRLHELRETKILVPGRNEEMAALASAISAGVSANAYELLQTWLAMETRVAPFVRLCTDIVQRSVLSAVTAATQEKAL